MLHPSTSYRAGWSYVLHGWLDFHSLTSSGSSKQAELCIQPKIRHARSFYLTRWLWPISLYEIVATEAEKGSRRKNSASTFSITESIMAIAFNYLPIANAYEWLNRLNGIPNWRHWLVTMEGYLIVFGIRRWANRSAQKSNQNGMLPCMWGIIVINTTAYHLGRYSLHLLLGTT